MCHCQGLAGATARGGWEAQEWETEGIWEAWSLPEEMT